MLSLERFLIRIFEVREVGERRVRAGFQAAAHPNQISHGHVRGEWVAAWPGYISLHIHRGRIRGVGIFVDQHAIARLKLDVFVRISGNRLREIDAEDFEFSVGQVAENLRIFALRVGAEAAGELDGINETNLPRSAVGARLANVTPDGNRGRIFEVEFAVDANRIHRLEQGRVGWIRERVSKIEVFDRRMEVRRIQTNDFGVATGRFRKQVFVRRNDVRDAHVVVVRVPAWAKNVAVEIDGVLVVGRDGKHTDAIAILHLKGFELRSQIARLTAGRNVDGEHGLLFVRDEALNLDMAECGSGQQATG